MSKEVKTHKLGELQPDPNGFVSLMVRPPGWHPDAFDGNDPDHPGEKKRTNVFLEEAVGSVPIDGTDDDKVLAFHAQFEEGKDNSRWILGSALHSSSSGGEPFTLLLNDLATLARRYNAALYTLRRLKFHFDQSDGLPHQFPLHNLHSRDQDLSGATKDDLRRLAGDAELDWNAKSEAINDFIDGNASGFSDPAKYEDFVIEAADMIEVNNYIVSMRVIVSQPGEGVGELVGSSSHVSISSAFSSGTP